MIVFVIPLRNPEIAQDWDRCNALCQQTVRSALAQIDGAVRVIVVGKDFVPDVEDARLTVLRLPFRTPERNWEDQHRDKYLKIAHGLVEARKHAPCYVMKLDADDLISRHLSSAAHDLGHRPGYYLPYGYLWLEGSRVVRPVENFHHHCGSSNILWCEADELPASIDDNMSKFRIMRWGHNITVREFDKLGTPLMPLPIRSAIYRKGSGENITGHLAPRGTTYSKPNWKYYIGQALRLAELRPFTRTIQRDFFGANSL